MAFPGFCAMWIAAVAVSVGRPLLVSLSKSVVHGLELGPVELTQLARAFANVSSVFCGAVPIPDGVVVSATPVLKFSRFGIAAKALAMSCTASVLPELETCVALVANPAIANAVATVETSFITT